MSLNQIQSFGFQGITEKNTRALNGVEGLNGRTNGHRSGRKEGDAYEKVSRGGGWQGEPFHKLFTVLLEEKFMTFPGKM